MTSWLVGTVTPAELAGLRIDGWEPVEAPLDLWPERLPEGSTTVAIEVADGLAVAASRFRPGVVAAFRRSLLGYRVSPLVAERFLLGVGAIYTAAHPEIELACEGGHLIAVWRVGQNQVTACMHGDPDGDAGLVVRVDPVPASLRGYLPPDAPAGDPDRAGLGDGD